MKIFKRRNLTGKEKVTLNRIFFAKRQTKDRLDLSGMDLKIIPLELFDLHLIKVLNLSRNKLTALPAEFQKLKNLKYLDISYNNLDSFPQKSFLPPNLQRIISIGNKINKFDFTDFPTSITHLTLANNNISDFYYTSSSENNLRYLDLCGNHLKSISIEQNNSLEFLDLSHNMMRDLTVNISATETLKYLFINKNLFIEIPLFVFDFKNLEILEFSENKLTTVTSKIIQRLPWLEKLALNSNNLDSLPEDFYRMSQLKELQLSQNKFKELSPKLSRLPKLELLEVFENPLESPPKAVTEQGSTATIIFLKKIDDQNLSGNYHRLWNSKLIVVGEGGVGKTSLVKSLKGKAYDSSESTTHGIKLESIEIEHPREKSIQMHLNVWDFGGQQIYHATHQFFLTDNSIFVFVWSARTEFNSGRPYYWLDMISANAPNAPIVLVATHLDQRRESIPLDYLKEKYPQITDFFEVSSVNRKGVNSLYLEIKKLASNLPLMGKPWLEPWDNATKELRENSNKIIDRKELNTIFNRHGIDPQSGKILAKYLHDLGEILQYPESENLKNLIILKPQWISEYISKVITSNSVIDSGGILKQEAISSHWSDLDARKQEMFLELMEQYDLAYKIPGDSTNKAIIVEQLHPDRPQKYQTWRQRLKSQDFKKVEIEYRLSSMQPGLPTWFIARSHRFSLGIHWRRGAIFTDGKEKRNLALVEAFDQEKLIRLTVVGTNPHNFMSILKDGLELTFKRYPGLKVRSFVPCPENNDNNPCEGKFPYQKLEEALDRGLPSMQCQSCFSQIEINKLLFGIGGRDTVLFSYLDQTIGSINDLISDEKIIDIQQKNNFENQAFIIHQVHRIIYQAISTLHEKQSDELTRIYQSLEGISDNFDLLHRRFISQFKAFQAHDDSHCPSTFLFKAGSGRESILNNAPLELHLLCQHPKQIHPATQPINKDPKYSPYIIHNPKEWLCKTLPYINAILQLISYAPFLPKNPLSESKDLIDKCIDHMEYVTQKVDDFSEGYSLLSASSSQTLTDKGNITVNGSQLRVFRTLLDKLDPSQEWQGLKKWLSPEGHYLWLCPYHFDQCNKHFDEFE